MLAVLKLIVKIRRGLTKARPPRLLRRFAHRRALDAGGAILEFGDFPEWIERRVGEEVRRGLDIGERDEDDAVGDRIVLARRKLDAAAAGRNADRAARREPKPRDLAARQARDRTGLERVARNTS